MKKSNFALRLQPSLYEAARELARQEGVAMNQLINVAVAQMLAAHGAANYLATRAKRGNGERALAILQKAGNNSPASPGDELPEEGEKIRPSARPGRRRVGSLEK